MTRIIAFTILLWILTPLPAAIAVGRLIKAHQAEGGPHHHHHHRHHHHFSKDARWTIAATILGILFGVASSMVQR